MRSISQLEHATDEELARWAGAGEEPAFAELVERYRLELYHFLARFCRDAVAAEDLFQETFVLVFTHLDRFDDQRRFKPWLFTIAANKARDWMRRNKRKAPVTLAAPVTGSSDDAGTTTLGDLLQADLPQPHTAAEQAELRQQVRQVVDDLPDHLREVLLLSYFHQLAYVEIAQALEIPLGTVKSRLHAAVAQFAKRWRQADPDPSPATTPPTGA